jgi:exopolysaccharide biosynthesis polyprenyl glycosylphosphotransferase
MLFVLLSIWRVAKRFIIRKLIIDGYHNINIAIVGLNDTAKFVASEIKKNPHWGFKITGFIDDGDIKDVDGLPVLGKIKDCIKIAKNYFIDELIVTNFANISNLDKLMKEGKNISLGLNLIPENLEGPAILPNISYIGLMPLFSYKERKRYTVDFAAKRLFDFFSALILIILFFPISAIIAVLIKFDSNGTIFYVQKRVGYKGREFNFYKFRSMIMNADKVKAALHEKNEVKDGVIFKIKKDPRTTNIGRFLRKHSMDELPQLINVLKGDISLVGPRPSLPDEVKKYTYDCMQRLSIRPGMTCLSQVRGRSNLSFRKWVKWDLWYINNWSFWLDLKILWWTAGVVLKGKGAY